MLLILHRINTIEKLQELPNTYGVEIDIRGYGDKMFLTHNPIHDGAIYDELENYLKVFSKKNMLFHKKAISYSTSNSLTYTVQLVQKEFVR